MNNLSHIWPFFIVTDLKVSVSFYVDQLGFEIRHMGPGEDPYWAIVGRDNISLMLKAISPEVQPVPNHSRHEWAPWDAYVATDDPEILYEEYRRNKVPFRQTLHNNSDGLKGFEVADADGYVLFFGRPAI